MGCKVDRRYLIGFVEGSGIGIFDTDSDLFASWGWGWSEPAVPGSVDPQDWELDDADYEIFEQEVNDLMEILRELRSGQDVSLYWEETGSHFFTEDPRGL